ncbi:MAG: hypothetical protein E7591_09420 [Ruminococcaceae bacterium]|nr:hypothetical protein [Oscillospiraceae bacterium]
MKNLFAKLAAKIKSILKEKFSCIPLKDRGMGTMKFDTAVLIACLSLYVVFGAFMFSDAGRIFFVNVKDTMPFINLIKGTLGDISKALGWVFEKFTLAEMPKDLIGEIQELTFIGFFIDIFKLLLSAFIKTVIYIGFSFLFLHKGNGKLFSMLHKNDLIHNLNSILLSGIAFISGALLANLSVDSFYKTMVEEGYNEFAQLLSAIAFFAILYIIYSLFNMLYERFFESNPLSFLESLVKTLTAGVLPEVFTYLITNIIIVYFLGILTAYGFHKYTLAAAFVLAVWIIITKLALRLLNALFKIGLPFFGMNCPFSNFLWLPATVTFIALMYLMIVPNLGAEDNIIYDIFDTIPFFTDWFRGTDILEMLFRDFGSANSTALLQLFVMCNVAALLQYLSSSYVVTIWTQVLIRQFLIGLGFCLLLTVQGLLVFVLQPQCAAIEFRYFATVLAILGYIFYFAFQPYLALQGIFTTASMLLLMHYCPVSLVWQGRDSSFTLGLYVGGVCIFIGLNLLISLLQNLLACLEKGILSKFFGARKAAKATTALTVQGQKALTVIKK